MSIDTLLFIMHIGFVFLFSAGIVFIYKYRKMLLDENTELNTFMRTHWPKMFVFQKNFGPVIIAGFVLIILSNILNIIVLVLKVF